MSDEPLQHARQIIERFGGIRPMATKLDAPVTTVQGWKKRDIIPGARREEVLKAANKHNITLEDILSQKEAPTEASNDDNTTIASNQEGTSAHQKPAGPAYGQEIPQNVAYTQYVEPMQAGRNEPTGKIIFVFLVVVVAFLAAGLMTLAPKVKVVTEQADRIVSLERKLETVEKEQSEISETIPSDLDVRLEVLQEQASKAAQKAQSVASQATGFASGLNTESLEERLGTLETTMGTFLEQKGSIDLASLWTSFLGLRSTEAGRTQLDRTSEELLSWINRLQSEEVTVEESLPVIREESEIVEQTFEGINNEDMKAAALLLAMSQMRDTLRRDNESFETDLNLLRKLVGSENPALVASIDKLSPHANEGVLSPDGLKSEFKGMAGDIVVASLQGDDVSITEKAKARFSELLSLEKEGEPLTGTPTQIKVAKAQKKLDEGDIQGAIELLQGLDGEAANRAAPFIEEAELTLLAGQLQELLGQSIETQLRLSPDTLPKIPAAMNRGKKSNVNLETMLDGLKEAVPLGGEVSEDPESGFKIYKKGTSLPGSN